MGSKKRLFAAVAVVGICVVSLWLSTSVGQDHKRPAVRTHIYGVPEYKTDAARAIEAYERLMERHMDLTETNLFGLSADVKAVGGQLDRIDARLAQLDLRLARIETHLGIAPLPPPPPVGAAVEPNVPTPPRPAPPSRAPLP